MHELGIVFNIIRIVVDEAKKNNVSKINSITLDIGEVSTIIPSYLTDCYDWAKKKEELLKDSTMKINLIKAVTTCNTCRKEYPTVEFGKTCPHCGSTDTVLKVGNEVEIKEIEAI